MKIVPVAQDNAAAAPRPKQTFSTGTAPNTSRERALNAFKAATPGGAPQKPVDNSAITGGQKDSIEAQAELEPTEVQEEQVSGEETELQTAAVEGQEEAPAAPEEDPALSSQYAALARREKALRAQAMKQESALKAREAALAAREAELASKPVEAKADYSNYISKDLLKQDAVRALADANVSYEELTQQILNQGSMDPRTESLLRNMEAKIGKLESQLEESSKKAQESKAQEYQAAIKQITTDVKKLVTIDPAFEMIKLTGSYKDVVDLIEANFKEKGEILTNEEAAQQVEDYLVEEAERLARATKIQKRLMPAASKPATTAPVQKPVQKTQQTQPQMKTLTNTNSSSRQLSARERALAAFRGDLK